MIMAIPFSWGGEGGREGVSEEVENLGEALPLINCRLPRTVKNIYNYAVFLFRDPPSPSFWIRPWLVSCGIDKGSLALRNREGHTPLHIACSKYDQAMARHLISIGCSPVDNPEPFADLDIALACGNETDFDLLSSIATKNNVAGFALQSACASGNMQAVRHFTQVLKCHDKQLLHTACAHSVEMVEYVIEYSEVNLTDSHDSETPLHIACANDKTAIVELLVKKFNCNPSVLNTSKEYPLHLSCKGSLETINLLTITPEHLLQVSSAGCTPLHVACKCNKLDIVQHLLEVMKELGLDISSVVERGTVHPLKLACETGNAQLVKCLIQNGVNMFGKLPDGNTILHIACSVGSLEMVEYLIDSGHDTLVANSREEFPLHIACTKNLDLVMATSYKCEAPALKSKTVDGLTPLHLAASCGLLDIVKYLIETLHSSPFTSDTYGNNALSYACGISDGYYLTYPTVVRYLVEHGCNPMENNIWLRYQRSSPILKAINEEDLHLFKVLCSSEVFINYQNEDGNTPLSLLVYTLSRQAGMRGAHLTERKNSFLEQAVEYLVKERCDQRIQNSKQELALHLACESGFFGIVKELDSHYCIKNEAGNTALHIVCQRNDLRILRHILLANGKLGLMIKHLILLTMNPKISSISQ